MVNLTIIDSELGSLFIDLTNPKCNFYCLDINNDIKEACIISELLCEFISVYNSIRDPNIKVSKCYLGIFTVNLCKSNYKYHIKLDKGIIIEESLSYRNYLLIERMNNILFFHELYYKLIQDTFIEDYDRDLNSDDPGIILNHIKCFKDLIRSDTDYVNFSFKSLEIDDKLFIKELFSQIFGNSVQEFIYDNEIDELISNFYGREFIVNSSSEPYLGHGACVLYELLPMIIETSKRNGILVLLRDYTSSIHPLLLDKLMDIFSGNFLVISPTNQRFSRDNSIRVYLNSLYIDNNR